METGRWGAGGGQQPPSPRASPEAASLAAKPLVSALLVNSPEAVAGSEEEGYERNTLSSTLTSNSCNRGGQDAWLNPRELFACSPRPSRQVNQQGQHMAQRLGSAARASASAAGVQTRSWFGGYRCPGAR